MHTLFMSLGLGLRNYLLMVLFYGIRGLAYPLFIYVVYDNTGAGLAARETGGSNGLVLGDVFRRHRRGRQLSA